MTKFLAVGAIDFGTSYSGYAYSVSETWADIQRKRWYGTRSLTSEKTRTCILFDADQNFLSFGFDAEDEFADICENKEEDKYYFFSNYKMELYNQLAVKKSKTILDIRGREMSLLKLVTETVRYLKQLLFEDVRKTIDEFRGGDILYVLTVPAIWSDSARAFMRDAAEGAGIPSEQLRICLEPEAAAIYCMTVPCQSGRKLSAAHLDRLKPGSRYILIDAGGGTADIVAHEVLENGRLKEIHPASGGNWGGTTVDNDFLTCMRNVHGEAFDDFKRKQTSDYVDLMREFEVKKRSPKVQGDAKSEVVLRVPVALKRMSQTEKGLNEEGQNELQSMTLEDEKIRFNPDRFKQFFYNSRRDIVAHLQELLRTDKLDQISTLIIVGGYAESQLLQDFIREEFHTMTVIIPNQPGLAVLKGAVVFGHDPSVIAERVCRFTYGISIALPFNENIHTRSTQITDDDGNILARGCFDVYCKVGQNVKTGVYQPEKTYIPVGINQPVGVYSLYACPRANPVYTNESDCCKIGELEVDRRNMTGARADREICVALCFGGTDITIRATKKQTGEILSASLRYVW